jgi:membrane protein CcdC involved in cytochrome C biogenesis
MLMLIVGIKLWTITIVFLISLGGCVVIQNQMEAVRSYEPAYKEFVKCVVMFAIILLFMALTVKKVSRDEMDDLLLYGTLPIMTNFLIVPSRWIIHRYREVKHDREQTKQQQERAHQGLAGDL